MWTSERCVGRLGNLDVCQLPLWGKGRSPMREGLKGSQESRFLVKETIAPVVHWSLCTFIRRCRGSDLPLLDCELLEGRDLGPDPKGASVNLGGKT